jgi:DNA-binding CsgD family transcriptional regulator
MAGGAVSDALPDACFRAIVEQLNVPVLVFAGRRIVYKNRAADRLFTRLRARYCVEPSVILRDQLARLDAVPVVDPSPVIALLTTGRGEPLHVHIVALGDGRRTVTIRELGTDLDAFRRRYRLSAREAQVAELVLQGFRNRDIAAALGITPATAKKHLTRIFEKVGVDSRVQLANRLA